MGGQTERRVQVGELQEGGSSLGHAEGQ